MTTRRGFLGFLAAAGIAVVAGPEVVAKPTPTPAPAPLPQAPLPVEGDSYYSFTYRPGPRQFDLVCYTGLGSTITLPNSLGNDIGCVIIKCKSKVSDWFVIETNDADITLPAKFNERGETYVAYQFGKEEMPKLQPYIDKLKEMQS